MSNFLFQNREKTSPRVGGLPFWAALSVAFLLSAQTTLQAAPMTFGFEAEVGLLPPFNADVGLPFTLEEGSVINGLITIDPDRSDPPFGNSSKSLQPFAIELMFNGFSFGTDEFEATAINDSVILDGPNAGGADFIVIRCSSGSSVVCSPAPLEFPGSPPLFFSLDMQLSGSTSLLQEPQLPNGIDVWNGFAIERSVRFSFATTSGNGAVFDATVASFAVVPEPSSVSFMLVTSYMFLLGSHRLV